MMLKGSKEALTVLTVTHVAHIERVESDVLQLLHNTVCIQSNVTHLTHVKRVESVLCIQGLSPLQGGRLFEKPSVLWV